ncbi:hypothetical protein DDE74_36675 [Streptomyces lydicus]|uniref:Uncharacterized protein n=2 Tax=Streptomyces lydicus TaxID=47763 RepID=A0A3Q9KAM9_9ACTN|nr:hypothetical protein DDE74_36675 [Streptomyces lydicus]
MLTPGLPRQALSMSTDVSGMIECRPARLTCGPHTARRRYMALHPLQGPLDRMIDYLSDAQRLHDVIQEKLQQTTAGRRAQGRSGGGQPGKQHSSLNRAVVVAAVGALEAFNEDLALTAQPLDPQATPPSPWYQIDGRQGMVQPPQPLQPAQALLDFLPVRPDV